MRPRNIMDTNRINANWLDTRTERDAFGILLPKTLTAYQRHLRVMTNYTLHHALEGERQFIRRYGINDKDMRLIAAEFQRRAELGVLDGPIPDDIAMLLMEVTSNWSRVA